MKVMSGVLSKSSFEFNDTTLDVIVIRHDEGENETYFFASKVAKMLGYKRPDDSVRRYCKKGVSLSQFEVTPAFHGGSKPHTVLIPESDVYRLVMRSKNTEAQRFQDFVCDEVLPSIRRYGTYPPSLDTKSQVPSIGYNIGVHEDRMKHFETLNEEQRKDMRKETLTETNSLKSEKHIDMGRSGGATTQKRWRDQTEEVKRSKERIYELEIMLAKVCC